jgi:hypothetical protein
MYKGASKKGDLVRILRERDYPDDTARPIAKWQNKELVEALIQSDLGRKGGTVDGVNAVFTQMNESEDNVEAVGDLKAGESLAAAYRSEADSLYGSSEDSEEESSNDEEDDEEAVVNTTAATKKATTAALRKAKRVVSKTYLSSTWDGGLPRTKAAVNEAEAAAVGLLLPNRDSCELLAGEIFEKTGSLITFSKPGCCKTVDNLTMGCLAEDFDGKTPFKFGGSVRRGL